MNKKLTLVCSFILCVVVMTSFVFASAYTDIMADLNSIYSDAEALNLQYEQLINTNASKIAAIPHATEAQNLADHIMQDNAQSLYTTIINEVVAIYGASDPLTIGLQGIKSQAKPLVDQVKATETEIKNNFSNMSSTELEAVINKVREIAQDFGGSETITADYNTIIANIDTLKVSLSTLNTNLENFANTYENQLKQVFDTTIAKSIADKVGSGKYVEALDIVKAELNNIGATQAVTDIELLKQEILDIKDDVKDISDKLKVSYVYLTVPQITNIKTKAEQIVNMYVTFTKHMYNTYSTPYINKLRVELYALDLNQSIDKANAMLDYLVSYKSSIASKKQEATKYLAVFAALGYDEDDIKDYIKNNYQSEYNSLVDKIDLEFANYVEHVKDIIDDEIADIKVSMKVYTERQADLRKLNQDLINVISKIETLKTRVNTEISNINFDFSDVVTLIDAYETTVYDAIHEKMLLVIEEILGQETTIFKYDATKKYIIYSSMPVLNNLKGLMGLQSSMYQYAGLVSGDITTSSKVRINLSASYFDIFGIVNLGDINSDRVYDISDVVTVIDKALTKVTLTNEKLIAADLNQNGVYDTTDITIMIDKSLSRI